MADEFTFELPQFAIVGEKGPDGKVFLGLLVTTTATSHQFYLCKSEDFRKTADGIRDGILKAGQDAVRENLGIFVANGVMPNGIRKAQGG